MNDKKPEKTYNTIYKSSYLYGPLLCQLFVNFKDNIFSFLIKKGNYPPAVFNLQPEEKMKIVKAILLQLTDQEKHLIFKELDD